MKLSIQLSLVSFYKQIATYSYCSSYFVLFVLMLLL